MLLLLLSCVCVNIYMPPYSPRRRTSTYVKCLRARFAKATTQVATCETRLCVAEENVARLRAREGELCETRDRDAAHLEKAACNITILQDDLRAAEERVRDFNAREALLRLQISQFMKQVAEAPYARLAACEARLRAADESVARLEKKLREETTAARAVTTLRDNLRVAEQRVQDFDARETLLRRQIVQLMGQVTDEKAKVKDAMPLSAEALRKIPRELAPPLERNLHAIVERLIGYGGELICVMNDVTAVHTNDLCAWMAFQRHVSVFVAECGEMIKLRPLAGACLSQLCALMPIVRIILATWKYDSHPGMCRFARVVGELHTFMSVLKV